MKRILLAVTALLMVSVLTTSCNNGSKKTKSGLQYKYLVKGDGQQVKEGDILLVEIWEYFDGELQSSNEGNPMPVPIQAPEDDKDFFAEALNMLKEGDSVEFVFDLNKFPDFVAQQTEQKKENLLTFVLKAHQRYTEEEYKTEKAAEEQANIAAYIAENGITVEPNADGVYVVVSQNGRGAVVTEGKTVSINYVGRFLDGKIFDTSLEEAAIEAGTFSPQAKYAPLEFEAGANNLIVGMDNAVLGMRVGTKAKLIIPSKAAYGEGTPYMPGYSTLVFDIEILSVK